MTFKATDSLHAESNTGQLCDDLIYVPASETKSIYQLEMKVLMIIISI